jgi:hypothetical protein
MRQDQIIPAAEFAPNDGFRPVEIGAQGGKTPVLMLMVAPT